MRLDLATLGNDLYTGKRSVPVVPQRRRFYVASAGRHGHRRARPRAQGLNLGPRVPRWLGVPRRDVLAAR